jgi:hypothetical protein
MWTGVTKQRTTKISLLCQHFEAKQLIIGKLQR